MLSAYTGTSDGGMVAQVYVQKYPGTVVPEALQL